MDYQKDTMGHYLFVAVFSVVVSTSSAMASLSDRNACVHEKNRAAAKAFACLVKGENTILWDGTADLNGCRSRLMEACMKAESRHSCPTTCATLEQRVIEAADNVLMALEPTMPVSEPEKNCVATKNTATARYVSSTATSVTNVLAGGAFPGAFEMNLGLPFIEKFGAKLLSAFRKAEARGSCLTMGDGLDVRALANPAALNMASADLFYRRFHFAYLVGADLSGANLRQADFLSADLTDADLSHVIWDRTRCPDSTRSDTNDSSPESCCAHLSGAVPAACE